MKKYGPNRAKSDPALITWESNNVETKKGQIQKELRAMFCFRKRAGIIKEFTTLLD